MKYTRKKIDVTIEKKIITGMIISSRFLREIQTILSIDLLQLAYAKVIGEWCIGYYSEYDKAPGNAIQDIYESEVRKDRLEDSLIELISGFLSEIAKEYQEETFNVDFVLDQSEEYLKKRKLEELSQDIQAALSLGESVSNIELLVSDFRRIARPETKGIDVLEDKDAIREAFEEEEEGLLNLPGDLGKVIGPLNRGDFLAVVGPAARGKTWWLQEFGIRGLFAGLKVLFVSLEMTQPEVIKRIHRSFLGMADIRKEIKVPVFDCLKNSQQECEHPEIRKNSHCSICRHYHPKDYEMTIGYKNRAVDKITWQKSFQKAQAIKKMVRTGKFKLLCYPAKSKSILDVITDIENMDYYDDFSPDLVVTDYADIFLGVSGNRNEQARNILNTTWEYHRALAQSRHCIVITGSHSNKKTFDKKIGKADIAEESRKLNHVTHAIALNQTEEEKEMNIMEISILKSRKSYSNTNVSVTTLQNLDISKVYLDSYCKHIK